MDCDADSYQRPAVKPLRTQHRFSEVGVSPSRVWARLLRMYVWSFVLPKQYDANGCYAKYHRTSPFDAILAGAEDVLGDLGVRQAIRRMPKNARL